METKVIEPQWQNFDAVTMLKNAVSNSEYVQDDGFRRGLSGMVCILQNTLNIDLIEAWNILKVVHAAVTNKDYIPDAHYQMVLNEAILLVEDRICDELNSHYRNSQSI